MNVLLVEDNPADAALLMDLFSERSPGLNVNWVADGSEALDYVMRPADSPAAVPDLVLLDLSLPRVNGYEVLKGLKENATAKKIPVIILSTSTNPKDIAECKRLGAAAFLSKPTNLAEYENLADCLIAAEMPKHVHGHF